MSPPRCLVVVLWAAACASDKAEPDRPGLDLGAPQDCPQPAAAPSWRDHAPDWGIPVPEDWAEGAGGGATVAVADFDGDGRLDLVFAFGDEDVGAVLLRQGEDGRWDPTLLAGLEPDAPVEAHGMGLGDLDGDGLLDLTLAGEDPLLMQNIGGDFQAWPLGRRLEGPARELLPADMDGDGDLDLVAGLSDPEPARSPDQVLWNTGDPWSALGTDRSLLSGPGATGENWDSIVWDADDDGDLDIYTVNDKGNERGPNGLYSWTGSGFAEVAADRGAELRLDGMGGALGDVNGDGWADLYVGAVGRDALLLGQADGRFADGGAALGAVPEGRSEAERTYGMPWGTAFWDADNDGLTDILVAEGDFGPDDLARLGRSALPQSLRLMHQESADDFEDETDAWLAAGPGHWRGVVPVDLNGDGVLDVVATRWGAAPAIFLSEGCTAAGWLAVAAPVGSVVELEVAGTLRRAWVTADTGYGAAREPHVWFGLGPERAVDALRVRLPHGTTVEEGPLAARRWVRVVAD